MSSDFVAKTSLAVETAPKLAVSLATGRSVTTDLRVSLKFSFGTGKQGKLEPDEASQADLFTLPCYVLPELSSDVILGMDFLARENPSVDW